MGRSRDCEPKISRGAELEWQAAQAHCKLSNRYASPTWGSRWSFSCSCSWRWRWRKSSALAALRFIVKYWNYTSCEPLELGQWENELCASCICILCRKKPSQLGEHKKRETKNKSHCGYRHDSCQSRPEKVRWTRKFFPFSQLHPGDDFNCARLSISRTSDFIAPSTSAAT